MDPGIESTTLNTLVISGIGSAIALPCPSERYLRTPKSRKFMGGQDHLAVCAAGRALESAQLTPAELGARAGLFLAVGFIPFERADIDALITGSLEDERISLRRFGTDGFSAVNPLLTFRCLPNMPAYHVSACFDIQGEYFVTYPGPGQFYLAVSEAVEALTSGRVNIALVGAVAHQSNFLVAHHYERLRRPVAASALRDAACFLIFEKAEDHAIRKGPMRGKLLDLQIDYSINEPMSEELKPEEHFTGCGIPDGEFGAASLGVALAASRGGTVRHKLQGRDGVSASSTWELA
jgi:hypothetical protein